MSFEYKDIRDYEKWVQGKPQQRTLIALVPQGSCLEPLKKMISSSLSDKERFPGKSIVVGIDAELFQVEKFLALVNAQVDVIAIGLDVQDSDLEKIYAKCGFFAVLTNDLKNAELAKVREYVVSDTTTESIVDVATAWLFPGGNVVDFDTKAIEFNILPV